MSTSTASGYQVDETPTKTKLLTALFAIGGVLSLPTGILLLGASSAPAVGVAGNVTGILTVLAIGTFVFGGISLTLAYGLWNVRAWSWYGTVLVTVSSIGLSLWVLLQAGSLPWYNLLIALAVLWALWDDQAAFGLDHQLPV
ncbi:hypothetical protein L593_13630 [Salinarchaeum sp. Harcht-Bsk1]|uniref:hypothetical protein n=1 Tax=Salinarchaeum sp. Harcht-Bsk1 TaxID=1333523 RepID=UPI0003424479|nr:hypothetical protein [Salinarchaeum sp. Harcht-Bsk1]AGN02665.1 hypothetical protein L593_13630 [Salinarchaeum sp. Harcht-Bsk1]